MQMRTVLSRDCIPKNATLAIKALKQNWNMQKQMHVYAAYTNVSFLMLAP